MDNLMANVCDESETRKLEAELDNKHPNWRIKSSPPSYLLLLDENFEEHRTGFKSKNIYDKRVIEYLETLFECDAWNFTHTFDPEGFRIILSIASLFLSSINRLTG